MTEIFLERTEEQERFRQVLKTLNRSAKNMISFDVKKFISHQNDSLGQLF